MTVVCMQQITPQDLHERLQQHNEKPLVLLDVRESWEFEICAINGARNIPMGDITQQIDTLDPEQPLVVICHHGIRSQQVGAYLEHNDFEQIINLAGGMDRWASDVDPDMATY